MASNLEVLLRNEHRRTAEVLSELEDSVMGRNRERPWDVRDEGDRLRLQTLLAVLDHDIEQHFHFEDACLFPALMAAGYGELTAVLVNDHATIREFARQLRGLAEKALADGFEPATWRDFRELTMDLVPSVLFHIQKEEMTVVRRLSSLLSDEGISRLSAEYDRLRG